MTGNGKDELAADSSGQLAAEDVSPQEKTGDRVAVLRAALAKLDEDPAEAARIDTLIADTDAMFGDEFALFEDPPQTEASGQDAQLQAGEATVSVSDEQSAADHSMRDESARRLVLIFNGDHAAPHVVVRDQVGQIVFNGSHAQPHIQIGESRSDGAVGPLDGTVDEPRHAVASLQAQSANRPAGKIARQPVRKTSRLHEPGPTVVAGILGAASAAIASHAITGAAAIVAITLAAAPVVWLSWIALMMTVSAWTHRRHGDDLTVLRLLFNRELRSGAQLEAVGSEDGPDRGQIETRIPASSGR